MPLIPLPPMPTRWMRSSEGESDDGRRRFCRPRNPFEEIDEYLHRARPGRAERAFSSIRLLRLVSSRVKISSWSRSWGVSSGGEGTARGLHGLGVAGLVRVSGSAEGDKYGGASGETLR